jgi:predicted acyl esterase
VNRAAILTVACVLVVVTSGCLGEVRRYYGEETETVQYRNPGVFDGVYQHRGEAGSFTLQRGLYTPYGPEVFRLRSPYPADPVAAGETGGDVYITLAIWRPAQNIGPVPVIVDAGPYFEMDEATIDQPQQTIPFLLQNYLPHGYAVAALAVRGTGTSGGCMELFGPREAGDLSHAITWLANQEWSNGNVAMIGASYDGSTPWLVAALGNPHLKTIVPVSGLPSIFDLMFRNGTAETRGPIMHSQVYWPFGFGHDFPNPAFPLGIANGREFYQNRQNLVCPDAYVGAAMGPYATLTGEEGAALTDYWTTRDYRQRVLDNYRGSVFLIHGLQDWNVDPHVAAPFNQQLREAGIPVKEWWGQWGHAFPDSQCNPKEVPRWLAQPCRLDYAETLLRWFDRWLKDNATVDTGPEVQVMDNRGYWRNAEAFPPLAADWATLHPSSDGRLAESAPQAATAHTLLPPGRMLYYTAINGASRILEFTSEPFTQDVRISGQPQFHVRFQAGGPGGFLGAWMFDLAPDGSVHDRWFYDPQEQRAFPLSEFRVPPIVGHAQMDLRYHAGGAKGEALVPGETYTARMEFEPLDVLIPEGHRLVVWLMQYGYSDKFPSPAPSPVRVLIGGPDATVLRLPTIDVDPFDIFPVPGQHFPKRDSFLRTHVDKPDPRGWLPPAVPLARVDEVLPLGP